MTIYEQQLSRDKRIEHYKHEILWYMKNDSSIARKFVENDMRKLAQEIGQEEADRWIESVRSKTIQETFGA